MRKVAGVKRPRKRWLTQPASQDIQDKLAKRLWPAEGESVPNQKAWKQRPDT